MRYEEKPIPVLFGHKENCCGCSACYAVCPVQAISMVPDAEGFAYPVIDGSKCIRCGRCAAVCTFRRDQARKGMCSGGASVQSEPACPGQFDAPLCHAVKHKCLDIRMASRSGGVFTALSDPVLARGGVVYGCVLTDSFDAVHIRAAEPADRDRMRGSKYIQSNLLDTFLEVRADLEAGRDVLFSGTSCQVAGLRSFLKKDYAKLLCVDIVCHGVPSPRVWHAFLDWQRSRNHAEIASVDFRNKLHFGWSSHVESVYLQNGKRADSEVFKNLFFGHHVLRESCYKCPYKSTQHPGDLTIADYWGIDQAAPGFNDNKGVSLVLLNNPRGTEAFRNILPELDHRATRLEDSLQPMLVGSFERPRERERFWADFETLAFDRIARKYAKFGAINSVKAALRELKHKAGRLVRKCFPGARK